MIKGRNHGTWREADTDEEYEYHLTDDRGESEEEDISSSSNFD